MKKKFLNAADFNSAIAGSEFHNCFAAALSITRLVANNQQFTLTPGMDIGISFQKLAGKYGFNVKEVPSLEYAKGKYAFLVFGWFPMKINYFFSYEYKYIDFHIIRVNPNGSVLHKADFKNPAMDLESLESAELWDYREEINKKNYRVFVLA